ncbi:MAG: PIN domain-containing protein [Actinomycetota bacterium]|nr:PIN domain-containing protein [Actinomycetota bacterium]
MERLILDPSALISLERGGAGHADVLPDNADVAISAITASELLVGVELANDRYRERRSGLVEGAFERVDIIAFDLEIARHHALLLADARRAGQPRGAHDLQIAATARATGRTVVTTDATAFKGLPGVTHRLLS